MFLEPQRFSYIQCLENLNGVFISYVNNAFSEAGMRIKEFLVIKQQKVFQRL